MAGASIWLGVMVIALFSADYTVADESKACLCRANWTYRGPEGKDPPIVYHGCTSTPDYVGHQWCYVRNGAKCWSAETSLVNGEKRMYKECGGCACQESWKYNGPDGKSAPTVYNGCSKTPDLVYQSWCYVKDPATCPSAMPSQVPGETRKYKECGACACQDTWLYQGQRYQGCAGTPDWKAGQEWCYVKDAVECTIAKPAINKNETRKYKLCGACGCQNSWMYKGPTGKNAPVRYQGCAETPDWTNHEWCYVNSAMCPFAHDSTVDGERRRFRECGKCACKDYWVYKGPGTGPKGVGYAGCARTPDKGEQEWCYVQDPDTCEAAQPSDVEGDTGKIRHCGACACQDQWLYSAHDGKDPEQLYQGCSETPDFPGKSWCFVNSKYCRLAKTGRGETRKYKECGASAQMKVLATKTSFDQEIGFGGPPLVAGVLVGAAIFSVLIMMAFKRVHCGSLRQYHLAMADESARGLADDQERESRGQLDALGVHTLER